MFKIALLLIGSVLPCYAGELPDTGQTQSYTATFGEDHDYNSIISSPSYTDNGNGTITDNKTSLMWPKDGNGVGSNNGAILTWEQALTYCEGLNYAGYSDWRLPNIKELESIVNCGTAWPAINPVFFLNTKSDYYWSSTTYVPSITSAWVINFDMGSVGVNGNGATTNYYIRCVRAGP